MKEENSTAVSIPGFVIEWREKGALKAQQHLPIKVKMQLHKHNRKQFVDPADCI
jgi:hypothetical protein